MQVAGLREFIIAANLWALRRQPPYDWQWSLSVYLNAYAATFLISYVDFEHETPAEEIIQWI